MTKKILKIKKQFAKKLKTYEMREFYSRMFLLGADSKGIVSHMLRLPQQGGCNERQRVCTETLTSKVLQLYKEDFTPVGIFMIPTNHFLDFGYSNNQILENVKQQLNFLREQNRGAIVITVLDAKIYANYIKKTGGWVSLKVREI